MCFRFGTPFLDELTLLLPLQQCCRIRFSTLQTLTNFHTAAPEAGLGAALKKSLLTDDLTPVLLDPHFEALDRRVKLIIKTFADCLQKYDVSDVIVDDGF